jgi:hypothetical protein
MIHLGEIFNQNLGKRKIKSITTMLSIALMFLCISDLKAQNRIDKKDSGKITLKDIRIDLQLHTSTALWKMKSTMDRGIAEVLYDIHNGDWVNTERNEYVYSNERKSITIDHYNIYNEAQEFMYSNSTDITLDDDGRLLTFYAEFIENIYTSYEIFYNENGRIDSLFAIDFEEGFSERIEVRFTEITSDSLSFEVTYIDNGVVDGVDTNYAVERDGNYTEYYVYPDWTDRYTYYNFSMADFGSLLTDDLFLVEEYNDEFYPNSGWIPYSRSFFVDDEGVNVSLVSEYYDNGEWFNDGAIDIGYDSEGRIDELINYFDDGQSVFYNERFRVIYEQETSTDDLETSLPDQLTLHQNYPNPFNPSTNITYELSATSNVELKVYNMLGKEVAILVSGRQSAGTHTLSFDASNLPSGLYVYRLQAAGLTMSKSMMLIK